MINWKDRKIIGSSIPQKSTEWVKCYDLGFYSRQEKQKRLIPAPKMTRSRILKGGSMGIRAPKSYCREKNTESESEEPNSPKILLIVWNANCFSNEMGSHWRRQQLEMTG